MALLILLPLDYLQKISSQTVTFLATVSRVIQLRGHGNKPSEMILHEVKDLSELKLLKNECYQIIKILLEL